MERFSTFPFSVSCVSQSSVDVLVTGHLRRSRVMRAPSAPAVQDAGERDAKVIAGANISTGIQKAVMKGIKSISQRFFERTEEQDEGMMEIGYPTDVQHVAHVGLDGSSAAALFCLPPISLAQFQHTMNNS